VPLVTESIAPSEEDFAALVEVLAAEPRRRGELTDLLREEHPFYNQRGASTTARMRGWVLVGLARAGITDADVPFVLGELDTGIEPRVVAAAARALRSYPRRDAAFAPFVLRAIETIRAHDEPLCLDEYGAYAVAADATTAVGELLETLRWLGAAARGVVPAIEALRARPEGLDRARRRQLDSTLRAIRGDAGAGPTPACCNLAEAVGLAVRPADAREDAAPLAGIRFEDHDGMPVTFTDGFLGHPTIVVFFYTRCDNPLKCSLTVTKLARVQALLEARGLADRIHTAAITYDPGYDRPERLRRYGADRGLRLGACHRLLRATDGFEALRRHLRLGVNFVASLVNRHRIEAYALDARGRVAAVFERVQWDEAALVARAEDLLHESTDPPATAGRPPSRVSRGTTTVPSALAPVASLAAVFFPKCPVCWAAYASALGIAGVQLPYSPWLKPVLVALVLVNVVSMGLRTRRTRAVAAFAFGAAGALALLGSVSGLAGTPVALGGVGLTLAGSLASVRGWRVRRGAGRQVAGRRGRARNPCNLLNQPRPQSSAS